jgi:hypothetical protein
VTKSPSILPRFDRDAQERIAGMFRRSPPLQVIALLDSFEPAGDERAPFEKYYGWALYEAGDYCASRVHLVRALRYSPPASADRAMMRGLLGESYLRTSRLDRAERWRRFRRTIPDTICARATCASWVASIGDRDISPTRSRPTVAAWGWWTRPVATSRPSPPTWPSRCSIGAT